MNASPSNTPLSTDDAARLRRFLTWAMIVIGVLCIIDLITLFTDPSQTATLDLGADLGLLGCFLLSRSAAQRGWIIIAVWLLCSAFWAFALILVLTDPWLTTAVAFLPLLAVAFVLPYIGRGHARRLSFGAFIVTVLILMTATQVQLFAQDPPSTGAAQAIGALAATSGLVFLVLNQFHGRLSDTLCQTQAANLALQQSQAELEHKVVVRTAELESLLKYEQERSAEQTRLLSENQQQRATIRALSLPVLPISTQVLVMPIVGAVDPERLETLRQEALRTLERAGASVLILDITGVSVVDQTVAEGLVSVVRAAQLLGVQVWLVGIRPEVAQSLVQLQVDLSSIRTGATLQDVLARMLPNRLMI